MDGRRRHGISSADINRVNLTGDMVYTGSYLSIKKTSTRNALLKKLVSRTDDDDGRSH